MSIDAYTNAFIARMLTSGGDRRIRVPAGANTNIYGASPFPRAMMAYAASTANDISLQAFQHLSVTASAWPTSEPMSGSTYRRALEGLRRRIRNAYRLDDTTDIVFAPSGTDLEYVALALAKARSGLPVTNILLGSDEVGSGCLLAAAGRTFATETALVEGIGKGEVVEGLGDTRVVDIRVRDLHGRPRSSPEITRDVDQAARFAVAAGRHALAHTIHGSKTGLVLPDLDGIDTLRARYGERLSIMVDACQARIEADTIRAYLDRGAIVLLSGSKFMGGPPFSGFALVPKALADAGSFARGLNRVFRRGEWPARWAATMPLDSGANPGLLLRLEAALFELECFTRLASDARDRVILRFNNAVDSFADALGVRLVDSNKPAPRPQDRLTLENGTLSTFDLSPLAGSPDFATAQRWQRVLAARGIRLGQPVKCVRLSDGRWAGTLRVSLSMPLMTELAELDEAAIIRRFDGDMASIAEVLGAAARTVAA